MIGACSTIGVIVILTLKRPGASDFALIPLFGAMVLSLAISSSSSGAWLSLAPLTWLGTVSYSIYLVHPVIVWCFEFVLQYVWKLPRTEYYEMAPWRGDLLTVVFVALLLGISGLTYSHLEAPLRKSLRARLLPGKSV
jgi:peptidoglycan/LPS O-acetylase OafA/YrhL